MIGTSETEKRIRYTLFIKARTSMYTIGVVFDKPRLLIVLGFTSPKLLPVKIFIGCHSEWGARTNGRASVLTEVHSYATGIE